MTLPALVLIHGGEHSADCWDLTVDELHRQAPELRVPAVDLSGHRATPGHLATVTVGDWVRSAVAQIAAAGLEDVVVVGHSLAGLTVPGVVAKLGPLRVREMILAACSVPPQGKAIVDTLSGPLAWYVRRAARLTKPPATTPDLLAAWLFCNRMTRGQRRFALSQIRPTCAWTGRFSTTSSTRSLIEAASLPTSRCRRGCTAWRWATPRGEHPLVTSVSLSWNARWTSARHREPGSSKSSSPRDSGSTSEGLSVIPSDVSSSQVTPRISTRLSARRE